MNLCPYPIASLDTMLYFCWCGPNECHAELFGPYPEIVLAQETANNSGCKHAHIVTYMTLRRMVNTLPPETACATNQIQIKNGIRISSTSVGIKSYYVRHLEYWTYHTFSLVKKLYEERSSTMGTVPDPNEPFIPEPKPQPQPA